MKTVMTLFFPLFLSIKNSVTWKYILKKSLLLPFTLAFWFFIYWGAFKLLSFLNTIDIIGDMVSMSLLSIFLVSLLGFLLISNMINTISTFYMSKEIGMLMPLPVDKGDLSVMKMIETIFKSSWMVLSFLPPLFIAYGVVYNTGFFYYVLLPVMFLPFVLIPGGIGIFISHILIRIFPVKQTRNLLIATGSGLLLFIYLSLQSLATESQGNIDVIAGAVLLFDIHSPFLPSYWLKEVIVRILHGNRQDYLYPLLLFSSSAFALLLSFEGGKIFFSANIEKIVESDKNSEKRSLFNYPPTGMAIIWKDSKIFFRDAGQWSQLFIIASLIMIYVYNFKTIPVKALTDLTPYAGEIMIMLNVMMLGLIVTALSARFVFTSVSIEGRAFWIIKASPVKMRNFLFTKFIAGACPMTAVMVTVVVLTNEIIGPEGILKYFSIVTVIILCVSINGLALGLGAQMPKFKYENITDISISPGSLLFMLIAFFIVIITVSLQGWSLYLYKEALTTGQGLRIAEFMGIILCSVIIIMMNMTAFYLPLKKGLQKIEE